MEKPYYFPLLKDDQLSVSSKDTAKLSYKSRGKQILFTISICKILFFGFVTWKSW